jgi:hypothetical protein
VVPDESFLDPVYGQSLFVGTGLSLAIARYYSARGWYVNNIPVPKGPAGETYPWVAHLAFALAHRYMPRNTYNVERIHCACGLLYAVSQAMEDVGSKSEIVFFKDVQYYVAKSLEQPMEDKMIMVLDAYGRTQPWRPPVMAYESFSRSTIPGKVFVTISDGEFEDPKVRDNYSSYVEKMNGMGVVTIMLIPTTVEEAKKSFGHGAIEKGSKILNHEFTLIGNNVQELMVQLPELLVNLQRKIVEAVASA